MLIQISTDRTLHGSEELIRHFEVELATKLSRFSDHITRLEVHFSEETNAGEGCHAQTGEPAAHPHERRERFGLGVGAAGTDHAAHQGQRLRTGERRELDGPRRPG